MASPKAKSKQSLSHRSSRAARRSPPPLLRRAMLHSCLCFLLGLLAGLAPSDWMFRAINNISSSTARSLSHHHFYWHNNAGGWHGYQPQQKNHQDPQVLVVVTTTGVSTERERRSAGLTRTAHALRLVSPPVVWLVVEAARDAADDTALLLRRTGLVYRHVTYNKEENLSSEAEERHLQGTVAMGHIEQHRIRGVVLFAGLGDVYDLRLLEQLRRIRTFGAWAVATVWDKEKRVALQGPVCTTTAAGWFSTHDAGDELILNNTLPAAAGPDVEQDLHGFAFSTDLLLDPARWDRFPTEEPDQSQDSVKFLQRLLVEDYNKTTTMAINCSEIMAWRVDAALLL